MPKNELIVTHTSGDFSEHLSQLCDEDPDAFIQQQQELYDRLVEDRSSVELIGELYLAGVRFDVDERDEVLSRQGKSYINALRRGYRNAEIQRSLNDAKREVFVPVLFFNDQGQVLKNRSRILILPIMDYWSVGRAIFSEEEFKIIVKG